MLKGRLDGKVAVLDRQIGSGRGPDQLVHDGAAVVSGDIRGAEHDVAAAVLRSGGSAI